ncbi:hypothetical protein OUZ56_002907 [Daphnia magna]|uniref:Ig-like domain-containing protein n=1 Tax=Daphnia magna TaxID=35525 RepID=A0ABR0A785_9CRUS|nr:hypothetical protein OUZ56_002907 [Daphnia magna]
MGPEPPVSLSTCSPATNSDSVRLFSVAYQTRSGKVVSFSSLFPFVLERRFSFLSGPTHSSLSFQTFLRPTRPSIERPPCLLNSSGAVGIMRRGLFLGGQLVIYSLLIVANESKRIEIQETNQDDRLRLRKHSCVSSRAGHLGALPGLFVDQDGIDGCNHDHGPAPSFSAPENGSTVKGHHGAPAQLHCTVQELHHRAVSWMKKTEDNLQLLTVGESSHTADPRISPDFTYPHLWQLKFNPAMINDSGTYLCHISTDPPLIRHIRLEISGKLLTTQMIESIFTTTILTATMRNIGPGNVRAMEILNQAASNLPRTCQKRLLTTGMRRKSREIIDVHGGHETKCGSARGQTRRWTDFRQTASKQLAQ